MGLAKVCYTPKTFTPENKPLLSKGQWSMVQLFLVDAANLPLSTDQFPDEEAIPIFIVIHNAAAKFSTDTLPKSNSLGNRLYNYGSTAVSTFAALINLMDLPTPSKEAIQSLFASLKATADDAHTEATEVFNEVTAFIDVLNTQKPLLQKVIDNEVLKSGALAGQITILQNDIKSQRATITSAQSKIVHDQKVIDATVYYSWIPFIGTIIALAEIITSEDDIKQQINTIKTAIQAITTDNAELDPLNSKATQLTYANQFNTDLIAHLGDAKDSLKLIQGAWKTISNELGDILQNIDKAEDADLKNNACLAAVMLTTAATEWQSVANDAHNYMMNFYVTDQKKAA